MATASKEFIAQMYTGGNAYQKSSIPDYVMRMYDENYNAQKAQLDQNYQQGVSDLEGQQQKAQKQADTNLTRTYVEAAKAAKNYGEVQNAYGLSSGAMAQAKLAQGNQLQSDMTAIRTAQQNVDADVEREKGLLAQQYAAAIAKARAENNMEKAQALYQQAKEDDAALLQRQKEAANLMAGVGDYSLLAQLYGLTDAQLRKLQGSGSPRYYGTPNRSDEDNEPKDDKPKDDKPVSPAISKFNSMFTSKNELW